MDSIYDASDSFNNLNFKVEVFNSLKMLIYLI